MSAVVLDLDLYRKRRVARQIAQQQMAWYALCNWSHYAAMQPAWQQTLQPIRVGHAG